MNTYVEVVDYMKEHGCVPDGFNQWDLREEILHRYDRGLTVAHTALVLNCLPEDFDQWGIVDKNGWTVAHTAADLRKLPENFNQWDLRTMHGDTVIGRCIFVGKIPCKPFRQWWIQEKRKSVFEISLRKRGIYETKKWMAEEDWNLVVTDDGETCQEVYERLKNENLR